MTRAEIVTRSTYTNGAGMDTVMKPESPLQEIHRMKLVVRHFARLSAASRLYLAARLLNTTQSELERRGFFIR